MKSKKLINDPQDVVTEALRGMVQCHDHIKLLRSAPNTIVRADLQEAIMRGGRVALVSGGGSGHEPAHGGFVGRGMLTAAVCGRVFASPDVNSIYCTITGMSVSVSVCVCLCLW